MPKKLNSPVNIKNILTNSKKNPIVAKQKTITAKTNTILKAISISCYFS
ncbi:hypothetical protein KAJ61_04100 [Candidatus Parcubacteria bacterium]|nr:hypothetical protein [Candidatus Parcubacteria bacterium]